MLVSLLTICTKTVAAAPAATARGLQISPLREYLPLDAGHSRSGSVTVANLTESAITVTLSVQRFSVADYTYDYSFSSAPPDWITLGQTVVTLKPGKSQQIPYQVHPPKDAAPGGQYFTIFATSDLSQTPAGSRVQAASLLYLTVNGKLTTSSSLVGGHLPWISFGGDTTFSQTIHSTGNTHFFAYLSGRLQGLTAAPANSEQAHLMMPGTTRTMSGTIQAPFLPGVYKARYGYKTDSGQEFQTSRYLLYLPPWAIILPLALLWFGRQWYRRKASLKKQSLKDS
jgi:hypothetical protein